jgi:predicted molibdopterin-dependent oxidoreductase YjgC
VKITIDGSEYNAQPGQTVLEVARENGIYIPTLCYHAKLGPLARCRVCVVEIEGMRGLQPSCNVKVTDNMQVCTESEQIREGRKMVVQLLLSSGGHDNCMVCEKSGICELQDVAYRLGIKQWPRVAEKPLPMDPSSPFIIMNPNKCIGCGRCIEACNNGVINEVLTMAMRGYDSIVVCDDGVPMGNSSCMNCGECVQVCPTAALVEKKSISQGRNWELEKVDTICPYCGVGCQMTLHVDRQRNKIVKITGIERLPNNGMLCVKGRFGYDFAAHPDRLTKPLIKKGGKFEEAEWDEALDLVAKNFSKIKNKSGGDALAVLCSARCTNEDNYLLQKFTRAVLGTNNIDHCARL